MERKRKMIAFLMGIMGGEDSGVNLVSQRN